MIFENIEWKVETIRRTKKRVTVSICFNTVAAFVFGVLPFIFHSENFAVLLCVCIVGLALFVYLNYRNAKTLWTYSQFMMIYRMDELKDNGQWDSHVSIIDGEMDKLYAKKHT